MECAKIGCGKRGIDVKCSLITLLKVMVVSKKNPQHSLSAEDTIANVCIDPLNKKNLEY